MAVATIQDGEKTFHTELKVAVGLTITLLLDVACPFIMLLLIVLPPTFVRRNLYPLLDCGEKGNDTHTDR